MSARSINWPETGKEILLTFLVSLIIFVPITGVPLKGYDYSLALHRPLILALIVILSKFGIMLLRTKFPASDPQALVLAPASYH